MVLPRNFGHQTAGFPATKKKKVHEETLNRWQGKDKVPELCHPERA
jgi:hypothetical protein